MFTSTGINTLVIVGTLALAANATLEAAETSGSSSVRISYAESKNSTELGGHVVIPRRAGPGDDPVRDDNSVDHPNRALGDKTCAIEFSAIPGFHSGASRGCPRHRQGSADFNDFGECAVAGALRPLRCLSKFKSGAIADA